MKIIRDTESCYGCKCCQLMCGFHHTGTFNPDASSIRVMRDYVTGVITWSLDTTCDSCKNEPRPVCVAYCAYGVLTVLPGRNRNSSSDSQKAGGRVDEK